MPEQPLQIGDRAPSFTLSDQHGQPVTLGSLQAGKAVVLVFFPFAFSGICTGELREIRDDLGAFENDTCTVAGISCDAVFSLRALASAEGYFFPLLSDWWPHGKAASAFGVFDEARGFARRGTFLIDAAGIVRYAQVNDVALARDFAGVKEACRHLSQWGGERPGAASRTGL